ncbi:MAG: dihydrolipoyl dehydrogenase family protein [Spirochaetaceae bacterium]
MADLTVIGSGPGGLEAALQGAKTGLEVALVTATPPGGRATVGSLLPSKVWLTEAEAFHSARKRAPEIEPRVGAITGRVNERMKERSGGVASLLESVGVAIHLGSAKLTGPNSVTVTPSEEGAEQRTIESRYIVLATGSEPRFFPSVKPDGERIIAPRHTRLLREIPKSITFVGGGVTATEYASVFAKLGSKVSIVTDIERLLPRTDPELVASLTEYLGTLGIEVLTNSPVESVTARKNGVVTTTTDGRVLETEYAFIATGRRPDTEAFEESGLDLETDRGGWLVTDAQQRTSIDSIFAVGDITGAPLIANKAIRQARVAVAAISGDAEGDLISAGVNIEAVYTHPELAQVGPVFDLASREGKEVSLFRRRYGDALLPLIRGSEEGYLKLWYESSTNELLGAAAFGEHAAEILAPVQMAIERGMTLRELVRSPFAHPSLSEMLSIA